VIHGILDRANVVAAGFGIPPVTGGIVIGADYAPDAKVTLLLFGADRAPRLVAKLARHPETEAALAAEYAMLTNLWAVPARSVTPELPRPLSLERIRGRLMMLATAVPGTPLAVRYYTPGHVRHRDRVARDFAMAGAWLARFQEQTCRGVVTLGPDTFEEWISPILDRYRFDVGCAAWEARLFGYLRDLTASLRGTRVPVVAVHGDYAPGNILLASGQVSGVVDWELGKEAGLPFSDMLKFAASYGSYLDRACPPRAGGRANGAPVGHPGWSQARDRWGATPGWSNGTGILYAFFGSGWFPELVRGFVDNHLRRVKVPASAMQLFLPVFLAEQVLALSQPAYRNGYRALLELLWQETAAGRLRQMEAVR
jgi:hypothetical protein